VSASSDIELIPPNDPTPAPAGDVFEKVAAEAVQNMQSVSADQPPVKRGRGRPRKIPASPSPAAAPEAVVPPSEALDLVTPFKTAIQSLSKIPADRTEIPELAFDDNESRACAESLIAVLDAFVPDANKLDPKTAAVLGAAMTFGSVILVKHDIYKTKMAAKSKPAETAPPKNPEPNGGEPPTGPVMSSEQYFEKQAA